MAYKVLRGSSFLKNNFMYLFFWLSWVFTAVRAFLQLWERGLLPSCSAWASHCGGFSFSELRL